MPIPDSHMQERLSVSYVSVVVAKAGLKFIYTGTTEYGVDVYLQSVKQLPNGKFAESGIPLQCQIKSTTRSTLQSDKVVYDMEIDAYNKLVSMDLTTILILYCIPEIFDSCLDIDEDRLLLKRCCYWMHINGSMSENKSSKRIFIPRDQLFTPESANILISKLNSGEL